MYTASAASITQLIRSNTGIYDPLSGKIDGASIVLESDSEFLALTWVPVAAALISTAVAVLLAYAKHTTRHYKSSAPAEMDSELADSVAKR